MGTLGNDEVFQGIDAPGGLLDRDDCCFHADSLAEGLLLAPGDTGADLPCHFPGVLHFTQQFVAYFTQIPGG